MDLNDITKTLAEWKAQATYEGMGRIVVWAPKPVPDKILQSIFPGTTVKMVVNIKPDTKERLRQLFSETGCSVQYKGRHLEIKVPDGSDPGNWDGLCEVLSEDGYLESWQLGDKRYDSMAVKALESNPKGHKIDAIDIGLLHDALDKAKTVEDILNNI